MPPRSPRWRSPLIVCPVMRRSACGNLPICSAAIMARSLRPRSSGTALASAVASGSPFSRHSCRARRRLRTTPYSDCAEARMIGASGRFRHRACSTCSKIMAARREARGRLANCATRLKHSTRRMSTAAMTNACNMSPSALRKSSLAIQQSTTNKRKAQVHKSWPTHGLISRARMFRILDIRTISDG